MITFTATLKQSMTSVLKYLIDIMSQVSSSGDLCDTMKCVKQLYIRISDSGIELFTSATKVVVASASLSSTDVFSKYEYNDDVDLCVGVSLDIMKSFFKNVNKADQVTIEIENHNNFPDTIAFVLNETKGFSIKFNIVQNIDNNVYDDYVHVLDIPSSRYTNLYKEVGGMKRQVLISFDEEGVTMSSSMVDIAQNWVRFKYANPIELDVSSVQIKSDYLKMTSKLSHFDDRVRLSVDPETNILLYCSLGVTSGVHIVLHNEQDVGTSSVTYTSHQPLSITDL